MRGAAAAHARLPPALVRSGAGMQGIYPNPDLPLTPGGLCGLADFCMAVSRHWQVWAPHAVWVPKLCAAACGSNDGDGLVDVLLPRMAVLGAQPADILVLNFGVWVDHEQASTLFFWGTARLWGASVKLGTCGLSMQCHARQPRLWLRVRAPEAYGMQGPVASHPQPLPVVLLAMQMPGLGLQWHVPPIKVPESITRSGCTCGSPKE